MSGPPPIDPEAGINYIASQTIGECYYDVVQNILMFADIFRPIFASLANAIVQRGDGRALMGREPRLVAEVAELLGSSDATEFARFIVSSMRRYILIKYAEAGLTEADVEGWFGPIQSTCTLYHVSEPNTNNTTFAAERMFRRRKSINRLAGIRLAMNTARTIKIANINNSDESGVRHYTPSGRSLEKGKPTPGTFDPLLKFIETSLKLPLFSGRIFMQNFEFINTSSVISDRPVKLYNVSYKGRKHIVPFNYNNYTLKNAIGWRTSFTVPISKGLLALNYQVKRDDVKEAHSVAIIRYQNEYYYCDNSLGRAHKCYNNDSEKDIFLSQLGKPLTLQYYTHIKMDRAFKIVSTAIYRTELEIGNYRKMIIYWDYYYENIGQDRELALIKAKDSFEYIRTNNYFSYRVASFQERDCSGGWCRRTRRVNQSASSAASSLPTSSSSAAAFPFTNRTPNSQTRRRRSSLSRKTPLIGNNQSNKHE